MRQGVEAGRLVAVPHATLWLVPRSTVVKGGAHVFSALVSYAKGTLLVLCAAHGGNSWFGGGGPGKCLLFRLAQVWS